MSPARSIRFQLATLVVATLVSACARPSDTVRTYDLLRILPYALSTPEIVRLDVGTEAATPWTAGLSWNETTDDGTTFSWSDGPVTTFELLLAGPPDGALRLRGFPWPGAREADAAGQTVELSLNGVAVGTLELSDSVQILEIEIPEDLWATGRNLVEVRYGVVRTPEPESDDPRALGVAWDWLEIERDATPAAPVADLLRDRLTLPPGSLIEYTLDLEPGSELAIDRLRGGELIVALRSSDEARELDRLDDGRRLRRPLETSETATVWLTLANPGPESLWLTAPRIEARR